MLAELDPFSWMMVQFFHGRQIVDGQLDLLGTVSIERTSHLQIRIRSPSYCWQNLELSCLEWESFCKQIESARFCSSNRQVYRQISQTFQDCRRWGTHRAVVWIFRGNDMPIGVLVCAWRTSDAGLKRNDIHGWNNTIVIKMNLWECDVGSWDWDDSRLYGNDERFVKKWPEKRGTCN